jgi:hypothetical protein
MLKVAVIVSYHCRVVALLPRQAIEIWFVSERAVIHFRNVECHRTIRYIGPSNGAIESAKCVHHGIFHRRGRITLRYTSVTCASLSYSTRTSDAAKRATSDVSATTSAIGWPLNQILLS